MTEPVVTWTGKIEAPCRQVNYGISVNSIKPRDDDYFAQLFRKLSWTHFIELMRIEDDLKRAFHELQTVQNRWSVRELKRQLDLAAKMKTASEVGGDYYDFHVSEDGTLTIAVGDATGHGLKAGTLVASVKSLFVSLAYHPDIPHIFERISVVLKAMKLRGLFMAMTMVKVNGHQMSVSIAGMPSVLIWRAKTGCVEEVVMRALPLGGMANYQYRQQELTLAVGDVVVLMSDGLPERFNVQGEMLDDERIRQALPAFVSQSSEAIIADFIRLGEACSAGRAQDDDITFVVLKIKADTLLPQENL